MDLDLVCVFCILSFIFGMLVGKVFFPKTITKFQSDMDDADWWKRGEDPPEFQ
jgi:hypothetical protein